MTFEVIPMKILNLAIFSLSLIVSTSAAAQLYKCTGADGKRVVTDRPCPGSIPDASAALPTPSVPASAVASSKPVAPSAPKYARDERKIETPRTPEEQAAWDKYKRDYFAGARAQMNANVAEMDSACKKGNAKACEVIAECKALPGGCEF
jgi:hypothetical protein